MTHARAVAVVGYKDSGKTRVVEVLVRELTDRGYRVGTLKHTAEDIPLDTPGKDTWRHREAGSEASAILHESSTAIFIDRYLTVNQAAAMLGNLDFVVVEGFKSLDTMARIIVPREDKEVEDLSNGLEIAVADRLGGGLSSRDNPPMVPLDLPEELADIVEARAFPMLAGLDCGGCAYNDCRGLARAIMVGKAKAGKCVSYAPSFNLKIDDAVVPLGPFVKDVTINTVLGLVRSFKGVDDPEKVELVFELGERHE